MHRSQERERRAAPFRRTDLIAAISRILEIRAETPRDRAVLVGISGIDGSGKGFVSAELEQSLVRHNVRVANINIDPWLELPNRRFDPARPAAHFYERGIRFGEFFATVVRPFRDTRSLQIEFDAADATNAGVYRRASMRFDDVEVVLIDGIFLLRREFRSEFDLTIWVDCTFDTALRRALSRGQERLPPEDVVRDYETIYFAAQRIHSDRDEPRTYSDLIVRNDPLLFDPLTSIAG